MRIRSAATTLALLALVAGLAAAAAMPSSAAASGKPCWEQVIDDWLDNGTIDGRYKAACYQQALKHVPEDLRDYSNITDAISAALSDSLHGSGSGSTTDGTGSGSGSGNDNSNPDKPRTVQAAPPQSIYDKGITSLGTTKASSIPIPLLVLAALGTLLLVSAGGLAAHKRLKARRPAPPR
ncbi:MAG TPA: hypothetical protein VHU60_07175 [Gaiellaceae bacterium]|jgi:hypothetical protein|nr:hypothetical protein [Gaiellaceae bacterium]